MYICHRAMCTFVLSVSVISCASSISWDGVSDPYSDPDSASDESTESNEILGDRSIDKDDDYVDVNAPICSESCENGSCVDTDTCLCHNGYQPSLHDKFDCEPICGDVDIADAGCTNGVCIAPQVCQCQDGFVLSNVRAFTCIAIGEDGTSHPPDTTYMFWIFTSVVLLFISVTIIAFIVWTVCERKTTHVIDENVNPAVVKYTVAKRDGGENEVIICIKNISGDCHMETYSPVVVAQK